MLSTRAWSRTRKLLLLVTLSPAVTAFAAEGHGHVAAAAAGRSEGEAGSVPLKFGRQQPAAAGGEVDHLHAARHVFQAGRQVVEHYQALRRAFRQGDQDVVGDDLADGIAGRAGRQLVDGRRVQVKEAGSLVR